jgi:choline dehydrogenase-like flavoprotein
MNGYISLTRDRDTGSVYPDPITGRPCIDYTPSAFDSGHTLEGIIALAKICYITGASEIHPFVAGVDPFIRKRPDPATKETKEAKEAAAAAGATAATDDGNTDNKKDGESPDPALTPARTPVDLGTTDPDFTAWLARLRAKGNKAPDTPFASAHQMGTCRMSGHAGDGVVDSRGRVWDTENLLVADASVFPSASGVNPMVTNMAIADWIARGLARDLKEGK